MLSSCADDVSAAQDAVFSKFTDRKEDHMSNVISLKKRRRMRLGTPENVPMDRRTRPTRPEGGPGFVSIGAISAEIIRKLTEQ